MLKEESLCYKDNTSTSCPILAVAAVLINRLLSYIRALVLGCKIQPEAIIAHEAISSRYFNLSGNDNDDMPSSANTY